MLQPDILGVEKCDYLLSAFVLGKLFLHQYDVLVDMDSKKFTITDPRQNKLSVTVQGCPGVATYFLVTLWERLNFN